MKNRSSTSLDPEAGWQPLPPAAELAGTRSFVSGAPSSDRLRVRYFTRDDDRSVVGKVWFGPLAEGPPGHAHGGAIAAVLDEAMGAAAWLNGHPVVAAELATHFHALVPLSTVVCFEASLASVEGRKVRTRAVLRDLHGVAYATAEALFIELAAERFGEGARALLARATARSPR